MCTTVFVLVSSWPILEGLCLWLLGLGQFCASSPLSALMYISDPVCFRFGLKLSRLCKLSIPLIYRRFTGLQPSRLESYLPTSQYSLVASGRG
jgi:hypothetical protein